METLDGGRTVQFSVGEFVDLADGTQVTLHDDRGFSSSWRGLGPDDVIGRDGLHESETTLIANVLTVVLPDGDNEEEHPWNWLTRLARARGLDVTESELRALPYRVVLSPAVMALTRQG
ncbi:hypothetical protein IFT73_17925 [Aeromicrobium sp. CFBP 8757]|uniref:hypothetical protein n=1 Tax=Aeromicrobium sp. CFBP 8757 TaxID=2775288 RepID=UPI00178519FB|nr:hypothetical protein [Aeromicrobium sp. CFBP 8757]MBD8608737.1 hypothetical protein [Aeromicrobium sp. CFBP 8757]